MRWHRVVTTALSLALLVAAGCVDDPGDDALTSAAPALAPTVPTTTEAVDGMAMGTMRLAADQVPGAGILVDLFFPAAESLTKEAMAEMLAQLEQAIDGRIRGYLLAYEAARIQAAIESLRDLGVSADLGLWSTPTVDLRAFVEGALGNSLATTISLVNGSPVGTEGLPDEVIAASDAMKQAGLGLYIAAAQTDLTRLGVLLSIDRRRVAAATSDEDRTKAREGEDSHLATLTSRVTTYLAYVRTELRVRMDQAVTARMNFFGSCQTRSGDGWLTHDTWSSWFENGGIGTWSEASNAAVSLARCHEKHERFLDEQRRATTLDFNARHEFAVRVADRWAQTLDALGQVPAGGGSNRDIGLELGAIVANDQPCPAGFPDKTYVTGEPNVDYWIATCTRRPGTGSTPGIDFGGMYGEYWDWEWNGDSDSHRYNPITGGSSCPAGYQATQLLGAGSTSGTDHALYYCSRPHVPGVASEYVFGGLFSYDTDGGYRARHVGAVSAANPLTGAATCPVGFTATLVWGSRGAEGSQTDRSVAFCYRAREIGDMWNDAVPLPATALVLDGRNLAVIASIGSVTMGYEKSEGKWVPLTFNPRQAVASGDRVAFVTADNTAYFFRGGQLELRYPGVKTVALSGRRTALVLTDGRLFVSEDPQSSGWLWVGDNISKVVLDGDRAATLDGAGNAKFFQAGVGNLIFMTFDPWATMANAQDIVLGGNRSGVVITGGLAFVKESDLIRSPWLVVGVAVKQLALGGARIAMRLSINDSAFIREGPLDAPLQSLADGVKYIALTADRVGVITTQGGRVLVKEGGLDAPWFQFAGQ